MAWHFPSLWPQNTDNANATLNKILIVLLLQLTSGGGVGGSSILSGSGSPNGSVASTASPQLYFDTSGMALWINTGAIGTNVWTQLI